MVSVAAGFVAGGFVWGGEEDVAGALDFQGGCLEVGNGLTKFGADGVNFG